MPELRRPLGLRRFRLTSAATESTRARISDAFAQQWFRRGTAQRGADHGCPTHPRLPVRTPGGLPVCTALCRCDGRRHPAVANALRRRGPGRRSADRLAARRAHLELSVPNHDSAALRRRAPCARARPDRLRPLRQADSHRGLHLPAARRVGDVLVRESRPARRYALRAGLGVIDRSAHRCRAR
ncbi:Uncharacterised protein [Mycobacterium tuberculosis]|uniref:Uncharacterized protein n=1 Tax=Mycobacterium tuberculosis TaxID=1773 RepID=A0A654U146_MYCTX|nr:Uncharacterised protein [Mycobacterium tuberculosis]